MGGINVHPSLLPKYRGSSPIQYTILNQDKIGGVSIIELSPSSFDSGRILAQTEMVIQYSCQVIEHPISYQLLHDRMADEGANLLIDTISNLALRKLKSQEQDESCVSKAPKIKVDRALISWSTQTFLEIFYLYNAIGSKVD